MVVLATSAIAFATTRRHGAVCRGWYTYGQGVAHCGTAKVVPVAVSESSVPVSTIARTDVNGTASNGESYGTAPVDPSGEGLSALHAVAASPDYIAIRGKDGVVGYAKKADIYSLPRKEPLDVYARDLKTMVGRLYNNKGFIPVGVDPDSVTTFPPPPNRLPPP
jgi:hypothetical protein